MFKKKKIYHVKEIIKAQNKDLIKTKMITSINQIKEERGKRRMNENSQFNLKVII